jgi:hypothetical protein
VAGDLLAIIYTTQNLDWQLLTKRPQNWRERLEAASQCKKPLWAGHTKPSAFPSMAQHWEEWSAGNPPSNIWIGVSAGADQKAALEIPAKVHFLSCEPMLHALDEEQNHITQKFDWIIFGGESGKKARPCHIEWISEGVRFCRQHNIAPFVKQIGAVPVTENANLFDWPDDVQLHTGKPDDHGFAFAYIHLCDSHGGDMSEWPEDLRIREFPSAPSDLSGNEEHLAAPDSSKSVSSFSERGSAA